MTLEDSTTYQLILGRGRVAEAQGLVLSLGAKRFGPAPATVEAALRAITDLGRVERIHNRLFDATNWDDLLATP